MMLLNWIMLANELHRHSPSQRQDPLADPLDAPEWDGLRWALPLLAWMAQMRYRADVKPQSKKFRSKVIQARISKLMTTVMKLP